MNPINAVPFFGVIVLGIAVLWATQIVYGRRLNADSLRRSLLIGGWIALLLGVNLALTFGMGVLVVVIWFFVLVVAIGAANAYRRMERTAFVWTLSHCISKDIPLSEVARAFARDRSVSLGIDRVIRLLDQGAPLPAAFERARYPLPLDTRLALSVGHFSGGLKPMLQRTMSITGDNEEVVRTSLGKLAYFLLMFFVGIFVISFIALKIMPMFEQMFMEFDLALPPPSRMALAFSHAMIQWGPLFVPALLVLMLAFLLLLGYYMGFMPHDLPLVSRLGRRLDTARLLRSLGLAVEQNKTISQTLAFLSESYPKSYVRRKLGAVVSDVQQGRDWCDALHAQGLINAVDQALLKAAERVGNLAWALSEMADRNVRRFAHLQRLVLSFLFPLVVLTFGLIVLLWTLAIFMPLIALIQGLA